MQIRLQISHGLEPGRLSLPQEIYENIWRLLQHYLSKSCLTTQRMFYQNLVLTIVTFLLQVLPYYVFCLFYLFSIKALGASI